MSKLILETNMPDVELLSRGKVRDNYAVEDKLLIVATDRISAFDYILATGIPDKGRVLTQLSIFWFDFLKDVVPTHFLTANVDEYPAVLQQYRDQLEGRSMLVKRAKMIDIECVARGYLSGSGWKEYKASKSVCGIALPDGLVESSKLPEPIFTPATKEASGHDINISFERSVELIGLELSSELKRLTLEIYRRGSEYAATRGIILADTKFEFGHVDGVLTLGDEVLTPDSSRFWPADAYVAGGAQPSYDKQYVRDYLESIHWNKQPPAPGLPEDVAAKTGEKYREAYRLITGKAL